jgi:HlyD family secretion protein
MRLHRQIRILPQPHAWLAHLLWLALFTGATTLAQPAPTNGARPAGQRGVAALGRIEPAGGIVRVAAPSTPDAVSGAVLTRLHVERGSDVEAGQLLAEVDTAQVARARIAEARAQVETARREAAAASSLADEACVLADVAASRAKRKQELLGKGLASSEETELAKGDADAGVASCRARRSSALVAQARIGTATATLARHEAELERSYVRAPFAGRVIDVLHRPGELVGQDGVVELARVNEMHAVAEVFEADVGYVRVGQRARVRSPALPREVTGTVVRVRPKVQKLDQIGDDPVARKDARIVEVEVRLDDSRAVANLTNLQVEVEIGR